MTLVFVYGTLKRGYGNHRILKNSFFHGVYQTEPNFSLYDGVFPYAFDKGGEEIRGELYDVDDETLHRLDMLEGVPYHYNRIKTWVSFIAGGGDDHSYEAYIYVGNRDLFQRINNTHVIIGKTIWPNGNTFVEWGTTLETD